jgi:hypothetical protein
LQISSSASDLTITNSADVTDLKNYCSTLTGGSASVGLRADASSGQKVVGKDNNQRHIRTPKNDVYVHITLEETLAAGDVISFTGNGASNLEICLMADNTYSATEATSNHSYTIPSTSALVGKKELYISRATASNTYIESITIVRPDSDDNTTGIQSVNYNKHAQGNVMYDLMGRRITAPAKGQMYIMNGKKLIR